MERISDWLRGTVCVELFGAFPAGILQAAAAEGLELWDAQSVDDHTLRLHTYEGGLDALERLSGRSGCDLRVLRRTGGRGGMRRILRRPALLAGLALSLLLLFCSSLFVWDVEVQGTKKLSRGEVVRALEDCGFGVGSFWPGINTELLRSSVMVRLPGIAWMTVNVSGSRAVVALVERAAKPEIYGDGDAVELVAAHDGLIRRVSVLAGKPEVIEGQLVTAGERLIGAELESITGERRRVQAKGSVMAETWYEINAVCPEKELLKSAAGLPHSRFALIFGKKRVNLYIGSGKTIDGCDKIISEYTLGVKGLFSTPIRLVRERFAPYRMRSGSDCDTQASARRLYAMLLGRTQGQILSYSFSPGKSGGLCVLTLRAHCTENIARPRIVNG